MTEPRYTSGPRVAHGALNPEQAERLRERLRADPRAARRQPEDIPPAVPGHFSVGRMSEHGPVMAPPVPLRRLSNAPLAQELVATSVETYWPDEPEPPRSALISTGPRECTLHDLFGEHRAWHCKGCGFTGPAAEHPARCHGVPVAATVLIVRGWTGG